MATDYDASRRDDEETTDSLEELNARRVETHDVGEDFLDDNEADNLFELPGADLSEEELSERVVPKQDNEFTCSSCFLVYHRNRIAIQTANEIVCVDCA